MRKPRADEQEPHTRPMRWGELAQHSEAHWFSRRGKCGGCAAEGCVLTWGDPTEEMPWEVSRSHSSEWGIRGMKDARVNNDTGQRSLTKGRTDEESSDRVEGRRPVEARWPGNASARHDGKHGMVHGGTTARSVRHLRQRRTQNRRRRLIGTARCGPACRVVWDPGLIFTGQSRGPDCPGESARARGAR